MCRGILGIDTTIKPLYGKQEGAVVSYKPKKPGRPSHSYHTYLMAGLRLVMGVEVKAGNEHSSSHTLTGQHAHFDKARQVFMRISSQLQAWAREDAEQFNVKSVE